MVQNPKPPARDIRPISGRRKGWHGSKHTAILYGHKKQRRTPKGSDKRKMLQWIEAHNWNMDRRAATERNWWTQNQL